MKLHQKTNGYLIVASKKNNFYSYAIHLAETILDYYPDANITLVTEERFLDGREKIFDNVLYCDDHYRAKLWGMIHTPYDITFYIDADIECYHSDISRVFDLIGDADMVFTPLVEETEYAFKNRHFPAGAFQLNGGVCLYDITKPIVKEFLNDWYNLYKKQYSGEWWPTDENGCIDNVTYGSQKEMSGWDQFTLWWLTHKEDKYSDIIINTFEDWARWNYYNRYESSKNHNKEPIVLYHYSAGIDKDNKYVGGIF